MAHIGIKIILYTIVWGGEGSPLFWANLWAFKNSLPNSTPFWNYGIPILELRKEKHGKKKISNTKRRHESNRSYA